jgi:hypothetical protein
MAKPTKKKTHKITLYTCGVDWQHEIGQASDLCGKSPLYHSVKALKAKRTCWKECGIVKLSLTLDEWVVDQDFGRKR